MTDVKTDVVNAATQRRSAYRLTVVAGSDVGTTVTLDASSPSGVLIGQSPACSLRLGDRAVSRRHASLDIDPRGARIADLGSTNGTLVNGVRIDAAVLVGGELVELGTTQVKVDAFDPGGAPHTPAGVRFGRVLGSSVRMRRLYPLLARIAQANIATLVEGESGTGKELLAECLHEEGPRRAAAFVVFDGRGMPPEACLPVLFGDGRPEGTSLFERAEGGTLVVLEASELPLVAQTRLLRYLERGEIRAGGEPVVADVRVIVTSSRDLDREVQEGRFSEELFYHLALGRIELPPLREREGDVTLLARAFWDALVADGAPFPGELLAGAATYRWPGNVQELQSRVARRALVGALDPLADAPASPAAGEELIDRIIALDLPLLEGRERLVGEYERRYLERVLAKHGGNVSRAAAASGVARRYFHTLLAKHR